MTDRDDSLEDSIATLRADFTAMTDIAGNMLDERDRLHKAIERIRPLVTAWRRGRDGDRQRCADELQTALGEWWP